MTSKIDGTVLHTDNDAISGTEGTPSSIVEIANKDSFEVEGKLTEYDSLVVSEGLEVKISSDALPDEEWTGTVSDIDFFPDDGDAMGGDNTIVNYPFTVSVESGNIELLKPGYQMILNVITEEKKGLTVPVSAVVSNEEESYVYVIEDGAAKKRQVELGTVAGSLSEITSGVEASDQVVEEAGSVYDGQEVVSID